MLGDVVHQPRAPVFSLSMAKTAPASLARILAYDNEDEYVPIVTVSGVVSFEEKGNPLNIATKF